MAISPTQLMEIGTLLGDIRAALEAEVLSRVQSAGFADVRPSHDCVFRYLEPEGTRLRDLAAQSRMTPQSVGEHVDELEGLGYVERVPDPSDRRAKLIRPTARGVEFMQTGLRALSDIELEWTSALGNKALERLRDELSAVRALQTPSA